eukprot:TRINITY_DN23612_c0_g1_i1.p1 TRINITY_DN23612_c0_g1~~TRINITY_DN23612_c0_g1_i1.p1  ORF type:complete len:541 (+),score=107.72 TRINITY_DN23612_c0_g1_i1:159-1781(+)
MGPSPLAGPPSPLSPHSPPPPHPFPAPPVEMPPAPSNESSLNNSPFSVIGHPPPPPNGTVTIGGPSFPTFALVLTIVGSIALVTALATLCFCWFWVLPAARDKAPADEKSDDDAAEMLTTTLSVDASFFGSSGMQSTQATFSRRVPLDDIKRGTDNFSSRTQIGEGGFGTVYQMKSPIPGEGTWAVKRAKKVSKAPDQATANLFVEEIESMSAMSHTNLLKLIGFCDEDSEEILVYEFMPNGNLGEHLHAKYGNPPLPFERRLSIAIGAAQGLLYLHKFATPAIIHRDIKSANILLDKDFQAKVADFGLLKRNAAEGEAFSTQMKGSIGYVDPEYWERSRVSTKSDVYSFGVVLLELISGRPPHFLPEGPQEDASENNKVHITEWALPLVLKMDAEALADPRMGGNFPRDKLIALAQVAAVCVRRSAKDRPEMEVVCGQLSQIRLDTKSSQISEADLAWIGEPFSKGGYLESLKNTTFSGDYLSATASSEREQHSSRIQQQHGGESNSFESPRSTDGLLNRLTSSSSLASSTLPPVAEIT